MNINIRRVTFIIVTIIYVLLVRGAVNVKIPSVNDYAFLNPQVYFESSQERARYIQMKSILETKSFSIDKYKEFAKPDLAWINGYYYPAYPPGISILLLPFFALGSLFGIELLTTNISIIAITLLTGYTLMKIAKKLGYSDSTGFTLMVVYNLSTLAISYGISLFQHNVSAFIITLCFYVYLLIDSETNNNGKFIILSGLAFLAFIVDYPNLIAILPIIVASVLKKFSLEDNNNLIKMNIKADLLTLLLGLVLVSSAYLVLSNIMFKDPFVFTNRFNLRVLDKNNIKYTEENLNMSMFKNVSYSKKFNTAHLVDGLNVMLFSADRGLFFYSPVFLFLPYGIYKFHNHKIKLLIMSIALLNLFFYASYDDPWGGWSFGPRYLLLTMPLFTILLLPVIESLIRSKFIFPTIFTLLSSVPILGAITSNLIPPIVESHSFKISSVYTSYNYLLQNRTGSFLYQNLLIQKIDLIWYYMLIILLVLIAFILVQKNYSND